MPTWDRPIGHLSRGNRQRIGLIQALFHEPELLLLDEPTSGLDPLMQEEFLTLVAEERDRGRTVFLSSHELDEVERVCSRVGVICDGRLIAVEGVSNLTCRAYRNVVLDFTDTVHYAEFASLRGVSDLDVEGGCIRFKVTGDINPVIRTAARHRLRDIELTPPSLEEIFLTYYADGNA